MTVRGASHFSTSLNAAGWESIKGSLQGDPGIWNLMSNIEGKYKLFGSHMDNSADKKAARLFAMLEKPLAIEFKEWHIQLGGEKTLDEACRELQAARSAVVDRDLNQIWRGSAGPREYAQEKGAFSVRTYPIGVPAIRSWMASYEGRHCLVNIKTLNLSGLYLSVLPEEIFMCLRLEDLQLHTNNFSSFPYDLNTWPHLKRCNLSSNRLQYFFESTTSHPNLKMLDLSSNLLRTFSCNFNGYPQLEGLYLHGNPFEALFCTLNMCSLLKELSLTTTWVKNFHFQLSPVAKLCQDPIVNMSIHGCGFSFPALRAESNLPVPLGWRLSVFINDPLYSSASTGGPCSFSYPFSYFSGSWKGMIPLMKNFKFALIRPDRAPLLETRQEWRSLRITEWRRGDRCGLFEDVFFSLS